MKAKGAAATVIFEKAVRAFHWRPVFSHRRKPLNLSEALFMSIESTLLLLRLQYLPLHKRIVAFAPATHLDSDFVRLFVSLLEDKVHHLSNLILRRHFG